MSRALRLTQLLQLLRRHRRPVAGQTLAEALGISLRTLYRAISRPCVSRALTCVARPALATSWRRATPCHR